ncbi:MAG TPA: hypothetical protein VMS31_17500 [Pyrinomonadaceae bacterium]|nr:hypothetical protein [Pyrinomonadaceae bacterium]
MDERFKPPQLDSFQIEEVQNHIYLCAARRRSFRLGNGLVRLLVDGDEHLTFDPIGTVRREFSVPANTGFIELRADDNQGDILLAAFVVPECLTAIKHFIDEVALPDTSGRLIAIKISSMRRPQAFEFAKPLMHLSCSPVGR